MSTLSLKVSRLHLERPPVFSFKIRWAFQSHTMSLLIAYLNSYQTDSKHTLSKLSQLSLPRINTCCQIIVWWSWVVNLLWCRKRKLPNSSKTGSNFKSLKTEKDYQHIKLMLSMLQQGILCSTVIMTQPHYG